MNIPTEKGKLHLIKLRGIERGYLKYLPLSIPAIRDTATLIDDIFQCWTTIPIRGHLCLHKLDILKGLRPRALKVLGKTCIVCGLEHDSIEVHHIKPHWRTFNNAFGFTVLCEEHHKMIRNGIEIGMSNDEVRDFCLEAASPDSQWYDPPDNRVYPESPIVKMTGTGYFYVG